MKYFTLVGSMLVSAALSSGAMGKPIFEESTIDFGLGFAKPFLRILPNSEIPENFYLIPKKFVGTVRLSDFFGGTATTNLLRQNLGPDHAIFKFLVSPDISLQKAISVAEKLLQHQELHPEFFVSGLDCPVADLSFTSIPRALYSSARVRPLVGGISQYIYSPINLDLPKGYFYTVELETTNPEVLLSLLKTNGAKGAAVINCDGYVSQADINKPSINVGTSIPIDAKFFEVVELD